MLAHPLAEDRRVGRVHARLAVESFHDLYTHAWLDGHYTVLIPVPVQDAINGKALLVADVPDGHQLDLLLLLEYLDRIGRGFQRFYGVLEHDDLLLLLTDSRHDFLPSLGLNTRILGELLQRGHAVLL